MVKNTLLRSTVAQLGDLRASLDGLRQGGATASAAAAPAAAAGADLLGQVMALLPSFIEYAGIARQIFGSRGRQEVQDSPGRRIEVQRSKRPGLGRRLRRYIVASLALSGCYLAYRLTRPGQQNRRART